MLCEVRVVDERVREPHDPDNFYNNIINLYLGLGLTQTTYGLIEIDRMAFFSFNDLDYAFDFHDSLISRVKQVSIMDCKIWKPIVRPIVDIVIDDTKYES